MKTVKLILTAAIAAAALSLGACAQKQEPVKTTPTTGYKK